MSMVTIPANYMIFDDTSKNRVFNFVTCNASAEFSESGKPTLTIQTPTGTVTAVFGDAIVQVGSGIFYVVPSQDVSRLFGPVKES
jgi:hypothetical protein